jgi:hypothetical protein
MPAARLGFTKGCVALFQHILDNEGNLIVREVRELIVCALSRARTWPCPEEVIWVLHAPNGPKG